MNDLRYRLAGSLHRQAAAIEPSRPLAYDAYRRARRIRLRRRVAAGVACLAVLAVVVPLGANLLPRLGRPVDPASTPSPTPSASASPSPTATPTPRPSVDPEHPVRLNLPALDSLPRGRAPEGPWLQGTTIHDGDRTVPVPARSGEEVVEVHKLASGYIVTLTGQHAGSSQRIVRLSSDGTVVQTLPNLAIPIVSDDRTRFTWTSNDRTKAYIADGRTGNLLHQVTLDPHQELFPVGFLGERVLFAVDLDSPGTWIWDPRQGDVRRLSNVGQAHGTDGDDRLAANTRPDAKGKTCGGVWAAEGGQPLWTNCGTMPFAFTSDRSLVLGVGQTGADGMTSVIEARQVTDGALVLRITSQQNVLRVLGERGGTILIEVNPSGDATTFVRCTLQGRCERAGTLDAKRYDPPQR